jgi:hypothetical protein
MPNPRWLRVGPSQIAPGDHVRVLGGVHEHHGVVVPGHEGPRVVHWRKLYGALIVSETSLQVFRQRTTQDRRQRPLEKACYGARTRYNCRITVLRTRMVVGLPVDYNLGLRNCEHLSTFIVTGRWVSPQAQHFFVTVVAAVTTGVVAPNPAVAATVALFRLMTRRSAQRYQAGTRRRRRRRRTERAR